MAWKRGTQNNIPGEIRKGHIREFLFPSSKGASTTEKLLIIDANGLIPCEHSTAAFISTKIPESFSQFSSDGTLFIHCHEHPNSVLKVVQHAGIPEGCIALNETQRINSKVCVGDLQEWTVYQGEDSSDCPSEEYISAWFCVTSFIKDFTFVSYETNVCNFFSDHYNFCTPLIFCKLFLILGDSFAYDAREGAIGDTTIRQSTKPPSVLQRVVLAIRPRHNDKTKDDIASNGDSQNKAQSTKIKAQNLIDKEEEHSIDCRRRLEIDAINVIKQYTALLLGCIISLEDVYTTQFQAIQIVGRIAEVQPVIKSIDINDDNDNNNDDNDYNANYNDNDNENEEYEINETYRGIVGLETEIYLILENSEVNFNLLQSPKIPPLLPHRDLINVYTKDNEHFPVLRRLLRPCISLTSIVQKGKGIYNDVKHQHHQVINENNKILNKDIISVNQDGKEIYVLKPYYHVANSNSKLVEYENLNVAPQTSLGNENNKNKNENENDNEKNVNVNENENVKNDNVSVDVDACTFDKVLLYLEHEVKLILLTFLLTYSLTYLLTYFPPSIFNHKARGDAFKFDPLLATELREASLVLGVKGLQDVCDKGMLKICHVNIACLNP